jgi:hypothetical protein
MTDSLQLLHGAENGPLEVADKRLRHVPEKATRLMHALSISQRAKPRSLRACRSTPTGTITAITSLMTERANILSSMIDLRYSSVPPCSARQCMSEVHVHIPHSFKRPAALLALPFQRLPSCGPCSLLIASIYYLLQHSSFRIRTACLPCLILFYLSWIAASLC